MLGLYSGLTVKQNLLTSVAQSFMTYPQPTPKIIVSPNVDKALSTTPISDYKGLLCYLLYFPHTFQAYADVTSPIQFSPRFWLNELYTNTEITWWQDLDAQLNTLKTAAHIYLIYLCLIHSWVQWLFVVPSSMNNLLTQLVISTATLFGILLLTVVLGTIKGLHSKTALAIIGLTIPLTATANILYIAYGRLYGELWHFTINSALILGMTWGLLYNMVGIWYIGKHYYVNVTLMLALPLLLLSLAVTALALIAIDITIIAAGCTLSVITYLLVAIRPDAWLLALYCNRRSNHSSDYWVPQVTPIPLQKLSEHLENHLELDWIAGIHFADELWRYTLQQRLVRNALSNVLAEIPTDKIFINLAYFATPQHRFEWSMFFAEDWKENFSIVLRRFTLKFRLLKRTLRPPRHKERPSSRKSRRQQQVDIYFFGRRRTSPLYTAADPIPAWKIVVIGFYHLANGEPEQALVAFKQAPKCSYAAEMHAIAQAFTEFWTNENLQQQPVILLPKEPVSPKQPNIWAALRLFQDILRYIWLARNCHNQAHVQVIQGIVQEKIVRLYNEPYSSSLAREMIFALLLRLQRTQAQPVSPVPVRSNALINPFCFATPLHKPSILVGRETALNQISLYWRSTGFPPILILGAPFVGKSSLVLVAKNLHQHQITTVYWKCKRVGNDERQEEQILDQLCQSFEHTFGMQITGRGESATKRYAAIEQYIRMVCTDYGEKQVAVVLDDFEQYDNFFINYGRAQRFLNFLEHLYQVIPNLRFVFTAVIVPRLFQPDSLSLFSRIAQWIQLQNLDQDHLRQLLQRPPEEFVPQFLPGAINRIWQLTGGQPYLVQLLAHTIVHRYQDRVERVHSSGILPEPVFDENDVAIVAAQTTVHNCANNYFASLSATLAHQVRHSMEILDVLSRNNRDEVGQLEIFNSLYGILEPNLTYDILLGQLNSLQQWGLVECNSSPNNPRNPRWRIRSELYSCWLRDQPSTRS